MEIFYVIARKKQRGRLFPILSIRLSGSSHSASKRRVIDFCRPYRLDFPGFVFPVLFQVLGSRNLV